MSPQTAPTADQHHDNGHAADARPEPAMAASSPPDAGADAPGNPAAPLAASNSRLSARLSRSNTQTGKDKEAKGQLRPAPSHQSSVVGLDPLSSQIYMRTNSNAAETTPTIAQLLRVPGRPESPNPEASTANHHEPETSPGKPNNTVVDATKEWRKGSSFLSRFSVRAPWARDDDARDSDSEMGDLRDDGLDARALTSVVGAGGGYIPLHKEPPRYIRVKHRNKKLKDFNHLFLAQELSVSQCDDEEETTSGREPATAVGRKLLKGASAAIWAAEFSVDGKYLAIGGKDNVVRIFAVLSTPEDRKAQEEDEAQTGSKGERLSAPVFRSKPIREFAGHTGEVLALSWSKNGFLLSSSMDKTVKLWYPSRQECLATFQHADIVTSIAFHPTDDRFFIAGCLDSQLRLWSIPDKSAPYTAATNEFITAVGFSPDGKVAICGVLSGMCTFYKTEGLESEFQIHVRSSRGKNAKGSKITGIETALVNDGSEHGDVKVLISSNDSRLRVYSLTTRMLEAKYRGHINLSSQIHARFSEDGKYIICGSEDRRTFIWGPTTGDAESRDKQPYEYFDAHPEVVTVAVMAPTKSRQLLSASGDPIYDLCNPPPVMLVSLGESQNASEADASEGNPTNPTPTLKKPEETPAYIERSKHQGGNIIVTTDRTGSIKVFRQDCAYVKRQQNLWETGSRFSGKLGGGVGRSSSIRTKASATSRVHSRRGSLSLNQSPAPSLPASDRIMSWRQDVDGGLRPSRNNTPTRSERSVSPNKAGLASINTSAANLASESRKELYGSSPGIRSTPASPTSSVHTNKTSGRLAKDRIYDNTPMTPPAPSFSFMSIADAKDARDDKVDGSFWNLSRWKGQKGGMSSRNSSGSLAPPGSDGTVGRRSLGSGEPVSSTFYRRNRASSGARLASAAIQQTLAEERPEGPERSASGEQQPQQQAGRL